MSTSLSIDKVVGKNDAINRSLIALHVDLHIKKKIEYLTTSLLSPRAKHLFSNYRNIPFTHTSLKIRNIFTKKQFVYYHKGA